MSAPAGKRAGVPASKAGKLSGSDSAQSSAIGHYIMGSDLAPYPPSDQDERLQDFLNALVDLVGPISLDRRTEVKQSALQGAEVLHHQIFDQMPTLAERRDKVISIIDAVRKSANSLRLAHHLVKNIWEENQDAAFTLFQTFEEGDPGGSASEVGFSQWQHIVEALEVGVAYMEASSRRVARSGYYGPKAARNAGHRSSSSSKQRGVGRPSKSWQSSAVLQAIFMLEECGRLDAVHPKGPKFRRLVRSFIELAADQSISEDTIESVAKGYLLQLDEEGAGRPRGERGGKPEKPT